MLPGQSSHDFHIQCQCVLQFIRGNVYCSKCQTYYDVSSPTDPTGASSLSNSPPTELSTLPSHKITRQTLTKNQARKILEVLERHNLDATNKPITMQHLYAGHIITFSSILSHLQIDSEMIKDKSSAAINAMHDSIVVSRENGTTTTFHKFISDKFDTSAGRHFTSHWYQSLRPTFTSHACTTLDHISSTTYYCRECTAYINWPDFPNPSTAPEKVLFKLPQTVLPAEAWTTPTPADALKSAWTLQSSKFNSEWAWNWCVTCFFYPYDMDVNTLLGVEGISKEVVLWHVLRDAVKVMVSESPRGQAVERSLMRYLGLKELEWEKRVGGGKVLDSVAVRG
ncbi:hypothetical protein HK097_001767 [Rhizophlyctis rosea]|uniref:Uncharacterized protein n=1 Tax=Rhizophlyctis rosea TaxID=64517 RepID=A0AAD5WYR7_9FUNG|nr:hypothetical protein HK097_001767 [Rhizophlyctis rosea]